MKLQLLNRSSLENSSFSAKSNHYPNFLKIWHYHPELELVAIIRSSGTRYIGDNIEKFKEGDVVLIGKNLPHMWHNEDKYFSESSDLIAEAIAVHFRKEFLGPEFFDLPEMEEIDQLLERSRLGIRFFDISDELFLDIKSIVNLNKFDKTLKLLSILHKLAIHESFQLLSSEGFVNSFKGTRNLGLYRVYEYVFKNFKEPIFLKDVADIANMNPSSFSRFFKRVNRKTFSRYLNEIRVGFACKLLIENKYNITSVCYKSGFNNISNFNRQFRTIKKMSPSEYFKQYRGN